MTPVVIDFLDLSCAYRSWLVSDMRRAFDLPADPVWCRASSWPARWWFSKVVVMDAAGAIILPCRGLRPVYLDKLWSSVRGRGDGGRLMSLLAENVPELHWRTRSDGWYRNWADRRGAALRGWNGGRYTYMRTGWLARTWEAEDAAADWLTMPSAWRP